MARNIVQLNNRYIQDENQHRRYLEQERRKKNRFMGWVLILVILLFILPTFNLVQSYRNLLERRTQLTHLYNPRIVATVRMENLLKTIEQFLEFSDEKLEELSRKNQALKLEETKKERGEHA